MRLIAIFLVLFGGIIISGCLSSGQSDIIQSSSGSAESDPTTKVNKSGDTMTGNIRFNTGTQPGLIYAGDPKGTNSTSWFYLRNNVGSGESVAEIYAQKSPIPESYGAPESTAWLYMDCGQYGLCSATFNVFDNVNSQYGVLTITPTTVSFSGFSDGFICSDSNGLLSSLSQPCETVSSSNLNISSNLNYNNYNINNVNSVATVDITSTGIIYFDTIQSLAWECNDGSIISVNYDSNQLYCRDDGITQNVITKNENGNNQTLSFVNGILVGVS